MTFTASKGLALAVVLLSLDGCTSSEAGSPGFAGGAAGSAGSSTATSGGTSGTSNNGGATATGTGGDSSMGASGMMMDSSAAGGAGGAGAVDSGPPPATAYVYISGYDPTITILSLDMATGKLSPKGSSPSGGPSTSYLAFSPDKQFLYAINEADGAASKVYALKLNQADGSLTAINSAPTGGNGAPHLSVLPGGKLVLVAHYNSGEVSTLKVDANGGVVMPPADVEHPADKTSHQAVTDPSGKFLFVPNVDSNTVFQFTVDSASGKLTSNGQVAGYPAGAGPRHIALHPNGQFAYTINETAATVSSLTYDSTTGKLSNPQTIDSLPAGARHAGATGAHIIVHPSGKFVFTSNRGHNSISVFAVDANGHLAQTSNETGGGLVKNPRDFGMDPSGKFLVVANQDSASVVVFEISPTDGKLTQRDTRATPTMPTFAGVVFLP